MTRSADIVRSAGEAEGSARLARAQASRAQYVSDLRLASELWNRPDAPTRAVADVLADQVPIRPGDPDNRDFAWRLHWTLLNRSAPAVTLPEPVILAAVWLGGWGLSHLIPGGPYLFIALCALLDIALVLVVYGGDLRIT